VGATALVWLLAAGLASTISRPAVAEDAAIVPAESVIHEQVVVLPRESPDVVLSQRVRTCEVTSPLIEDSAVTLRGTLAVSGDSQLLWAAGEGEYVAPASVQKLFTAVAAWRVLGPDHRLMTSVWGNSAGEAWLVGGGDPTITRSPGNNYYGATHSLAELAQKTVAGMAEKGLPPIQVLHVDGSRYDPFESWDESWRRGAWSLGYVAPVTAIQVDGDRDIPALRLGKRSTNPEGRAHAWFVEALATAQPTAPVQLGARSRPVDAVEVARIESAPLSELIGTTLLDSDNTLAEVLAREVAIAQGTTDYTVALRGGIGWDESQWPEMFFRDGSGLSPLNRLSATAITSMLSEIASDPELDAIARFLPVSAETGSLQRRFQSSGSLAAGVVSAKTGSIEGVRSLAGYITAADGETLTFSLNVSGPGVSDAQRSDLDELVEGLYLCGENLAHWGIQPGSTSE
jgi:D-alanyl-D-alanine carboxypeptidase/D-alanyl-D-alanine-endopeptidase (penicillin-binding protein 4)